MTSVGSRQSARIQLARSKVVPLPPRVIGPLLEESVVDGWKVVATGMTGGRDMLGTTDPDTMIIREQTNHLTLTSPHEESKSDEVRQETHYCYKGPTPRGDPALGCHSGISKSLVTKPTLENQKGWGPTPLLTDSRVRSVQPKIVGDGEATWPTLLTG